MVRTKGEHMKRQLTQEQIEKRDARRAQFRSLIKQLASIPELQRVQVANKYGIRTVEGHELSLCNTMLCVMQNPSVSMVGGFKQWLKAGRAVVKGQHGMMIWIPIGHKDESGTPNQEMDARDLDDTRFIIGTVFDIAQTQEIETAIEQPEISANLVNEVPALATA